VDRHLCRPDTLYSLGGLVRPLLQPHAVITSHASSPSRQTEASAFPAFARRAGENKSALPACGRTLCAKQSDGYEPTSAISCFQPRPRSILFRQPSKVMRHPECETCQRLWRAYTGATNDHLRLIGHQKIAATRHDFSIVDRLEEQIRRLQELRDTARDAVRDHEREAHSKAAAAGTVGGTGEA
jgi:hypothetical protein